MRHALLVLVLASGCGRPPAAAAPTPAPAPASDDVADRLERVLVRMDGFERQLSALENRLADLEKELADAEAEEAAAAEEVVAAAPAPAPVPVPSPIPLPAGPARPPGPDPAAVYGIPADGHPFEGAAQAKVTIVQAREFACPFSERVRATMAQLLADYPGELKVVYRTMIVHPQVATLPHQAACAAHKQGHYVAMANLIYDKGFNQGRDLSRAKMEALAIELNLDLAKFTADMDGPCVKQVADDMAEVQKYGVKATPTFFINGRYLSGARPADHYKALIDEELAKARTRIRQGTRARDYYKKWVVGKGLKSAP